MRSPLPNISRRTGLLKKLTDPNGLKTSLDYDGFGRITKQVRPDQTRTTWAYTDCNSSTGCVSGTQHLMTVEQTDRDISDGEITRQYTYLDRSTVHW